MGCKSSIVHRLPQPRSNVNPLLRFRTQAEFGHMKTHCHSESQTKNTLLPTLSALCEKIYMTKVDTASPLILTVTFETTISQLWLFRQPLTAGVSIHWWGYTSCHHPDVSSSLECISQAIRRSYEHHARHTQARKKYAELKYSCNLHDVKCENSVVFQTGKVWPQEYGTHRHLKSHTTSNTHSQFSYIMSKSFAMITPPWRPPGGISAIACPSPQSSPFQMPTFSSSAQGPIW